MMPFTYEDDSFEDTRGFMARGGESPSAFVGGPQESPTFMMPRGQNFQSSSRGRRAPQASPTFLDSRSPPLAVQRTKSLSCSRKLSMSPDDSESYLTQETFAFFSARPEAGPVVLRSPYPMGPRESVHEAPAVEDEACSMEDDDLTDTEDDGDDDVMRTNEGLVPESSIQHEAFKVPTQQPYQRSYSVSHINSSNNRGLSSSGGFFDSENYDPSKKSPSSFKVPHHLPFSSRHESLSVSAPPCGQSPPLGSSIMDESTSPLASRMATSQKRRPTLTESSFPASSNLHQTYALSSVTASSSSSCASPSSVNVHEDSQLAAQHKALRQLQRDQQKDLREGHRARTLSASTNHLNTHHSSSFAMSPSSLSRPAVAEDEEVEEVQDSRFGTMKKKPKMILGKKTATSSSVFPPNQCVPLAETARFHHNSFSGIAPGRRGAHDLILPIDWNSSHSNVISADTMHRVLRGEFNGQMSELIVIDCRYPYEYEGGHIKGAINCSPWNIPHLINQRLFTPNITRELTDNVVIILHCEFSQRRAPKTHTILREVSRRVFGARIDASCYHNCYVLGGGFKNYYAQFKDDCNGVYVPELEPEFCNLQTKCKREDKLFFRNLESQPHKARYLVDRDRHHYFGI